MKNLSSYLMLMTILSTSFNLAAQENSDFTEVVAEYVDIKEALVADDYATVKQEVPQLKEALADAAVEDEERTQLIEAMDALAAADEIRVQRQAFAVLSDLLIEVLEEKDLDKTLYVQFCPMALGGEGANWLSLEKQVRNPYMGQKMPGCGSVREIIEN